MLLLGARTNVVLDRLHEDPMIHGWRERAKKIIMQKKELGYFQTKNQKKNDEVVATPVCQMPDAIYTGRL